MELPKEIRLAHIEGASSRPEFMPIHWHLLARCAADPKRNYHSHMQAVRAELLDREKPLPAILATDIERHEYCMREVAKTGKSYVQCYEAMQLDQHGRKMAASVVPFQPRSAREQRPELPSRSPKPYSTARVGSARLVNSPVELEPDRTQIVSAMNALMKAAVSGKRVTPETRAAIETVASELKAHPAWRSAAFARFLDAYTAGNKRALALACDEVLAAIGAAQPSGPAAA